MPTFASREALYRRVLGSGWATLPREIQEVHDSASTAFFSGRCAVTRGQGILSRGVASLVGFPKEGTDVPVSVRMERSAGSETWTRSFAGRSFSSLQFEGAGRFERLLCERFGPLTFGLALVADEQHLLLVLKRWAAFGCPLPMRWAPWTNSHESVVDGRFHFDVEIGHPLLGLIVSYKGWLRPEPSDSGLRPPP